jgi:phosphoribosylformylglycinamidine cyclo-ligase
MEIYKQSGVDYSSLDPAKMMMLRAASATSGNLERRGGRAWDDTRGETAFVFDVGDRRLAFVLECLGTKSVLAEDYLAETGCNRFEAVGYDAVAAVVNDLICVGALPLTINAYFATGSSAWYDHRERFSALVEGWSRACHDAGAVWGGGESPTLAGLVAPSEIELAGAAVGMIPAGKQPLVASRIQPSDEIVLFFSSGLHANGASLARTLAKRLDRGLRTPMAGGEEFGAAVLKESIIYASVLEELYRQQVDVHYMSHITGHGFLKLMRADRTLTYRVQHLPPVPPVLGFMVDQLGMTLKEAYATFNMGAGMAVFVRAGCAEAVLAAGKICSIGGIRAGVVDEGPRQVVLEPIDEVLAGEMYAAPAAQ